MFQPKRTKYKKQQKGRNTGNATRGTTINFGTYALKATSRGQLTSRQIEAARRVIVQTLERGGKVWIRLFPDKPVSARAAETRMGGGKGATEFWVSPVNQGRIIFEIGDLPEDIAREALRLASHKFSLNTKVVARKEQF